MVCHDRIGQNHLNRTVSATGNADNDGKAVISKGGFIQSSEAVMLAAIGD